MQETKRYTLAEIKARVDNLDFPFAGITELGSGFFQFRRPSFYAASAIHAGHAVTPEALAIMEINETGRYREEDPGTDHFLKDFPIQIIARHSRFEYDINRARELAIYKTPEMAWGLRVWRRELTPVEINTILARYDEFHQLMDLVVEHLLTQNRYGVIYDCHSYNYQREERRPWWQDPKPVINVGTGAINRSIFGAVIDDLMERLGKISIAGRQIHVAENEIFKGGYLARRLVASNYDRLFVPALEFKKIFMDEWAGEFKEGIFQELVEKVLTAFKENLKHPLLVENP